MIAGNIMRGQPTVFAPHLALRQRIDAEFNTRKLTEAALEFREIAKALGADVLT